MANSLFGGSNLFKGLPTFNSSLNNPNMSSVVTPQQAISNYLSSGNLGAGNSLQNAIGNYSNLLKSNNGLFNNGTILSNLKFGAANNANNILDTFSNDRENAATAEAYQNYLNYLGGITSDMQNQLEARADKYDNKLQNQISGLEGKMLAQPQQYEQKLGRLFYDAEPQFMREANTQLAELNQLNQDIANQSAEAQRQNRRQVQAELAQQGIRGGQAGILANRTTGELNRNLQRDINQNIYNEAANRQNSRLSYLSQKALYPYKAMTDAYGSSLQNANNTITNAYGNSYTHANAALSNAYGNSLYGANQALSNAQGNVYTNAYNNAMNNYMNAQKKGNGGLGSSIGGLLGTAAGTYFGGPIGGAIGNMAGSYIGGLIK